MSYEISFHNLSGLDLSWFSNREPREGNFNISLRNFKDNNSGIYDAEPLIFHGP
jgi:hypothetical protein